MTATAQMPEIPAIRDVDRAFPIASKLPAWPDVDSLPREFQRGTHPACKAAESIFFLGHKGLDAFVFHQRYEVMTQGQGDDVFRLVQAHLGCWDYKHEHKIAGCGALLDRWFEVEVLS